MLFFYPLPLKALIGHCKISSFCSWLHKFLDWPQVKILKLLSSPDYVNHGFKTAWLPFHSFSKSFCSSIPAVLKQYNFEHYCYGRHLPHNTLTRSGIKEKPLPLAIVIFANCTFPTALESNINPISSKPLKVQRRGKVTADNLPSWGIASQLISTAAVFPVGYVFLFSVHLQHPPSVLSRDLTTVCALPLLPETPHPSSTFGSAQQLKTLKLSLTAAKD